MQVSKQNITLFLAGFAIMAIISRMTKPPNIEVSASSRDEPEIYISNSQSLPETAIPKIQGWDVAGLIRQEAEEYGVDPDEAIWIAYCESGLDQYAKNPNSTAKGIYQFLDGTWEWIGAQGTQYDLEENIRQFMIWYPKYPNWWKDCRRTLKI